MKHLVFLPCHSTYDQENLTALIESMTFWRTVLTKGPAREHARNAESARREVIGLSLTIM